VQASEFSLQDVLKDLLVQGQPSDQLLQLAVLSLQLIEPLQFAGTQPVVLPTPPVDGALTDSVLACNLLDRDPRLYLLDGVDDPGFGEPRASRTRCPPLHVSPCQF